MRWSLAVLVGLLVGSLGCGHAGEPSAGAAGSAGAALDGGTERRIGEELDRLRGALVQKERGYVKTSSSPGPQGTIILTAAAEGAYPGTGVYRAVFFQNKSYGTHGQAPLADLFRLQGWLAAPPPTADLATILDAGLFEGMGSLSEVVATVEGGGLRVTAKQFSFPDSTRAVVITLPASGAETIAYP